MSAFFGHNEAVADIVFLKYPQSLLPYVSPGALKVHGFDLPFLEANGVNYFTALTQKRLKSVRRKR